MRLREIELEAGLDDREIASMLTNALLIPADEFERYGREVEDYLASCERWLARQAEVAEVLRRTIRLDFEVINTGSELSKGLVLTLTLPKKLKWREALADGTLPELPEAPELPRTHLEIVRRSLADLHRTTVQPWSTGLEPVDRPEADRWLLDGQEARRLVDECLPFRVVKLSPIYATFVEGEEISNFAVSYIINQKLAPEPFDGRLLVRIL
jgi:hypothetical protein